MNSTQTNISRTASQRVQIDHQTPTLPSAEEILKKIKLAGCNKEAFAVDIMKCLAVNPSDGDLQEVLDFGLLKRLIEREDDPFISNAPVQADFPGNPDLILGRVVGSGCLWSYSYDSPVLSHIMGAGASGFGKTSWLLLLASQILLRQRRKNSMGHPFSLIPYPAVHCPYVDEVHVSLMSLEQKATLRYLMPWFENLYCFNEKTFRYNPWQPIPGVSDHRRVVESRLEILCAEFEVRAPSRMLLMDVSLKECARRGSLEGSGNYPAMKDILSGVYRMKFSALDRRRRSQESVIIRLKGLLDSLPQVFNVSEGFPIDVLDEINWSLELTNVAADVRRVLFSWLLSDLYMYRENKRIRGQL